MAEKNYPVIKTKCSDCPKKCQCYIRGPQGPQGYQGTQGYQGAQGPHNDAFHWIFEIVKRIGPNQEVRIEDAMRLIFESRNIFMNLNGNNASLRALGPVNRTLFVDDKFGDLVGAFREDILAPFPTINDAIASLSNLNVTLPNIIVVRPGSGVYHITASLANTILVGDADTIISIDDSNSLIDVIAVYSQGEIILNTNCNISQSSNRKVFFECKKLSGLSLRINSINNTFKLICDELSLSNGLTINPGQDKIVNMVVTTCTNTTMDLYSGICQAQISNFIYNLIDDYSFNLTIRAGAILNYSGQTINSTRRIAILQGGQVTMNISIGVTSTGGFSGYGTFDYTSNNDNYLGLLEYSSSNKSIFNFTIQNLTDSYVSSDVDTVMVIVTNFLGNLDPSLETIINLNINSMSLNYVNFIRYLKGIGNINYNGNRVNINYIPPPGPFSQKRFITNETVRGISFIVNTLNSNISPFTLSGDPYNLAQQEHYIAGHYETAPYKSIIEFTNANIRLGACNLVSKPEPAINYSPAYSGLSTLYYSTNSAASTPNFGSIKPILIQYSNTIS